jgi:hypothetical protein
MSVAELACSKAGTIAGVVIALVAAVLLIALAVLYYRRRQRDNTARERDAMLPIGYVVPSAAPDMHYKAAPVFQNVGATSSPTPSSRGLATSPTSNVTLLQPSAADIVPQNSPNTGGARLLSSKRTGAAPPPDLPVTLDAASRITDEQVDFVRGLHAHNVPIPAIARLMERMTSGEETPPEYSAAN